MLKKYIPYLLYKKIKNFTHHKIPDYRNAIIVARNPGQAKRATAFAERLRLGIAVIHGDLEKELESESNDGRNSPPPVSTVLKRNLNFQSYNLNKFSIRNISNK